MDPILKAGVHSHSKGDAQQLTAYSMRGGLRAGRNAGHGEFDNPLRLCSMCTYELNALVPAYAQLSKSGLSLCGLLQTDQRHKSA
jgi:hypothetical protein